MGRFRQRRHVEEHLAIAGRAARFTGSETEDRDRFLFWVLSLDWSCSCFATSGYVAVVAL